MNFDDLRQLAAVVRELPLEDVLISRGAVRDRRDKRKWQTEQGPLSITGAKFMNWQRDTGGGGAIDLAMHLGADGLPLGGALARGKRRRHGHHVFFHFPSMVPCGQESCPRAMLAHSRRSHAGPGAPISARSSSSTRTSSSTAYRMRSPVCGPTWKRRLSLGRRQTQPARGRGTSGNRHDLLARNGDGHSQGRRLLLDR